jgi:hypothetical protein
LRRHQNRFLFRAQTPALHYNQLRFGIGVLASTVRGNHQKAYAKRICPCDPGGWKWNKVLAAQSAVAGQAGIGT